MTYLLYGGNGWIGGKIYDILTSEPFNKKVIKSNVRLENIEEI